MAYIVYIALSRTERRPVRNQGQAFFRNEIGRQDESRGDPPIHQTNRGRRFFPEMGCKNLPRLASWA